MCLQQLACIPGLLLEMAPQCSNESGVKAVICLPDAPLLLLVRCSACSVRCQARQLMRRCRRFLLCNGLGCQEADVRLPHAAHPDCLCKREFCWTACSAVGVAPP